jgi:hypothetical protein
MISMGITREDLVQALDKSVKEDQRSDRWWVAYEYEVRFTAEGKRYIVSPYGWGPGGKEGAWDVYWPLVSYPGLFLKFARLAESMDVRTPPKSKSEGDYVITVSPHPYPDTDNNTEIARGWAEDYGVLGLTRREGSMADPRGGEGDTVEAFCEEARWAHDALSLYEAATGPWHAVDPDLIEALAPEEWQVDATLGDVGPLVRERALSYVRQIVESKVGEHCAPALHKDGDLIVQGWSFDSLLGAMWLQMMWLMTSKDAPRRCAGPGCNRIISYEPPPQPQEWGGRSGDTWKKNDRSRGYRTRDDKKFCSVNCRVKNWQHKQKNK